MSQKESAEPEPAKEPAPRDEQAQKLARSEEERRQVFDQLVRLKAEFENFRKRTDRDRPELIRHGKRELLERLIPLYDVLIAAHGQSSRHAELADDEVASELVRGLELIFKEFTKLFEAEGVGVIEALGKPYDFDRHEVLGQVMTDEAPEGTVVEELQRGYLLDGRTLRPSRVKIAKQPSR